MPETVFEFTPEEILRFAQWLAPKAGIHTISEMPTSYQVGRAIGKNGRKETQFVLVAHQRWPHILGLRSILTIKAPDKPHNWLINGQPGRNTHALRFDGEEGPCLIPSHQSVKAVLEARYGLDKPIGKTMWDSWMKSTGKRALDDKPVIATHLGSRIEIVEPLP